MFYKDRKKDGDFMKKRICLFFQSVCLSHMIIGTREKDLLWIQNKIVVDSFLKIDWQKAKRKLNFNQPRC